MAMYNASFGGNSVEIDGVEVDGDLKLKSITIPSAGLGNMPYNCYGGTLVAINEELHILGSDNSSYKKSHYKWDGTTWTSVSTMPFDDGFTTVVALNDEIHIMGGESNKYHYKWDGTTWTSVSTLAYSHYKGKAVVLNNEIHLLGNEMNTSTYKYHYKWDGTTWTKLTNLPINFNYGSAVVFNNEIYIMGGGSNQYAYKWDGTTWTKVFSLPLTNYSRSSAVVFKNEIHIMGSYYTDTANSHYKLSGSSWVEDVLLPFSTASSTATVCNEAIYIASQEKFAGLHIPVLQKAS